MGSELTVVIPVYNEEEIIQDVIKDWINELTELHIDFTINAYNDGSKDKTIRKLNELKNEYPALNVIDKQNSGHGPTILQGYRESKSEWIFQVDSDNEMKSSYFYRIWNGKENYDFILGKRADRFSPLSRKIISLISRLTIKMFYGRGIYDVNSPYRLYRREKFEEYFNKITSSTFAPNVILSGIAAKTKMRIKEITVPCQLRQTGEVSIKKWKLLRAALLSFYQTISFSKKIKSFKL